MSFIHLRRLTFVLLLVVASTFQIGGCRRDPAPPVVPPPTPSPAPNPTCDCATYSLVCNNGTGTCVALECEAAAYKDGRCSAYGGPAIPQPLMSDAGKLFGISFSSYQEAIRSGSGSPDVKMWNMIIKNAPNSDIAEAVRYMTNDFLYISLAPDFRALTQEGLSGHCEIVSVSDKRAMLSLVEAIKAGTILALEKGSPALVKGPVNDFFKKFPDFKPDNPGFCYTERNPETSAQCIEDILESRLELLIETQ